LRCGRSTVSETGHGTAHPASLGDLPSAKKAKGSRSGNSNVGGGGSSASAAAAPLAPGQASQFSVTDLLMGIGDKRTVNGVRSKMRPAYSFHFGETSGHFCFRSFSGALNVVPYR
jgi:hypothetical protein